MNGKAIVEIQMAPARIAVYQRGPVQIGQLMPTLLARYGVKQTPVATSQRKAHMAAVWLGQESLAALAERS